VGDTYPESAVCKRLALPIFHLVKPKV